MFSSFASHQGFDNGSREARRAEEFRGNDAMPPQRTFLHARAAKKANTFWTSPIYFADSFCKESGGCTLPGAKNANSRNASCAERDQQNTCQALPWTNIFFSTFGFQNGEKKFLFSTFGSQN